MHFCRYLTTDDEIAVGIRRDRGVIPTGYTDMIAFISDGEKALEAARSALESVEAVTPKRILAPIPNPGTTLVLGMTYDVFRQGFSDDQIPFVCGRVQSSIIGPGDSIRIPRRDAHIIYEGELVVVIGKPMYRVAAAEAMDYVFGYTQANDVTWVNWVKEVTSAGPQIFLSKNADTFFPLGPDILTKDEVDPTDLGFTVTVNGDLKTSSSTRGLSWSIARILEFVSQDMTLWPGDLISTGTSDAQDIVAGDQVVVELAGFGTLENPVIAGWE